MSERIAISKTIRFEVFKRDSFTCQYCGRKAPDIILHLDHINPIANKGDNSLMNLITSCETCNLGKSDRTLTDNSIIEKQRKQIEELEERRSQLQMLLDWRTGLKDLDEETVQVLCDEIGKKGKLIPNDNGRTIIRKWLKKYSVADLLEAIDASFDQYLIEDDNGTTSESWNKAFDMVPRIINAKGLFDKKPYMKDLFYIRAILRRRLNYLNERDIMPLLERAYFADVDIEGLKQIAKKVSSWTRFRDSVQDYLARYEGKEKENNSNEADMSPNARDNQSLEELEVKTQINLNDEKDFTIDNVAKLLASKDDSANRQLRVTKNGIAYISDEVGHENISGLLFRLETWDAGNGYCGPNASQNETWVKTLYHVLKINYPSPADPFIDDLVQH